MISGATDGSIAFWDITENVETFVQRVSSLNIEKYFDCQKRPRTGRGSQGGRQWRSLNSSMSKKRYSGKSVTKKTEDPANSDVLHSTCGNSPELNEIDISKNCSQAEQNVLLESETSRTDSLPEICEIHPIRVISNVHQSGVNCLHLSGMDCQGSDNCFLFNIVSGGDDQALNCLQIKLTQASTDVDSKILTPETTKKSTIQSNIIEKAAYDNCQNQIRSYNIRIFNNHRIASAHSSAIKGQIMITLLKFFQTLKCLVLIRNSKVIKDVH